MAKGVALVRPLGGQLEPRQCHRRPGGVGQVVEGVGGHRNGPGEQPRAQLDGEQQQVEPQSHSPGQQPAALPGLRVVRLSVMGDEAAQNGVQHERTSHD